MDKTLVFGASLKTNRYSNIAIHRLREAQKIVVAYGLNKGKVADVTIDTELKLYHDVDTVTLYMNPQRQKAYYDHIISIKPKRVIFNPGTENPEFYEILTTHQIGYEVACTLVLLATDQY